MKSKEQQDFYNSILKMQSAIKVKTRVKDSTMLILSMRDCIYTIEKYLENKVDYSDYIEAIESLEQKIIECDKLVSEKLLINKK